MLILPYLEQTAHYESFDFTKLIKAPENAVAVQQVTPVYVCPSAESASAPVFDDRADAGGNNPNPALGLYYPVSMGPTQPRRLSLLPGDLQNRRLLLLPRT